MHAMNAELFCDAGGVLLCYAMARGQVRMCMLHCDDPESCNVLSGDHIYAIRGRLQLLRVAVLLNHVLVIQQIQLPSDAVPLVRQLKFTLDATITIFEDYDIQQVRSGRILLPSW